MIRLLLLFVLLSSACLAADKALDLGPIYANQEIFELSTQDFEKSYMRKYGFRWTSRKKSSARAFGRYMVLEFPAIESIVTFSDGRVSELYLSIYNRGDLRGGLSESKFEKEVEQISNAITKQTGEKPEKKRFDRMGTGNRSLFWPHKNLVYRLEYSTTEEHERFQAEYVRLRVFPFEKGKDLDDYGKSERSDNPKENVVEKDNGDIYIRAIPMVDQGQKGYCACAATARIMQYYGRNIDQHQIAKIAQTGNMGTSPLELVNALEAIRARLHIQIREYQKLNVRDFLKFVKNYNSVAKRRDAPEINMPRGGTIDIDRIYAQMKPKVLIEAATKRNRTDFNKFKRSIKNDIKAGRPVAWSVMLGIVEEKGLPQARGGHMRLVIGYNDETDELIYSDTWGAGHEFKRMPIAHAFAITTGLFGIRAF